MYERILISAWKDAPNSFREYISSHKRTVSVTLGFETDSRTILILYSVDTPLGRKIDVTVRVVTHVPLCCCTHLYFEFRKEKMI